MNAKYMIWGVLAVLMLSSCYKEEETISSIGEPHYTIEDSSDPIDHYRYTFMKDYGVYILYEYTDLDYQWNINNPSLLDVRLVRQTDRSIIKDGLYYMEKILFDYYNSDFKKNYFPVKILMADTIVDNAFGGDQDSPVYTGRNYMAIGRIRSGLKELTADTLNKLKGQANGLLWANTMYSNGLINIADEFFESGLEVYGKKIGQTDDANFDPRKHGFWSYTESGIACLAPQQNEDVRDFVQMITSHTKAEMQELIKDFELLKNKYEILLNHLTKQYDIDIQAIGNKKPTIL